MFALGVEMGLKQEKANASGNFVHLDILRSNFTHYEHMAQSSCGLKRFSSLSEIPGQIVHGETVEVDVVVIALRFPLGKNEM